MSTNNQPPHVVKLGGSLLDLPDLVDRFQAFRQAELPARTLLVTGGGRVADIVRSFDVRCGIGEVQAHWLAIRAMAFNAHLLAASLPDVSLAAGPEDAGAAWERGQLAVMEPLAWLEREDRVGVTVPHDWDFTSDSIAAHVAGRLRADRLTLLKSALPEEGGAAEDAAAAGVVDRAFPAAVGGLPVVELVNLRASGWPRCRLRAAP